VLRRTCPARCLQLPHLVFIRCSTASDPFASASPRGWGLTEIEDQPHAKPNLAVVSGFLQGLSLRAPMLKPLDAVRWPLPCSVHV
jgi:hypothetical protein